MYLVTGTKRKGIFLKGACKFSKCKKWEEASKDCEFSMQNGMIGREEEMDVIFSSRKEIGDGWVVMHFHRVRTGSKHPS